PAGEFNFFFAPKPTLDRADEGMAHAVNRKHQPFGLIPHYRLVAGRIPDDGRVWALADGAKGLGIPQRNRTIGLQRLPDLRSPGADDGIRRPEIHAERDWFHVHDPWKSVTNLVSSSALRTMALAFGSALSAYSRMFCNSGRSLRRRVEIASATAPTRS